MSSMIAEKYADLLTVKDVVWLFQLLEKKTGSKIDAARICGLERKTTYDWPAVEEIRLNTKKKVLAALIDSLPEETLDFITEKSVHASVDILGTYLSTIYEKAMKKTKASSFLRLASRFEEVKQRYAGLITDYLEIEVGSMSQLLPEKATELGILFKISPSNVIKLSGFSELLPSLIKGISTPTRFLPESEIARIFNLPEEFVGAFSTALHEHDTVVRSKISTMSNLPTAGTFELPEKAMLPSQNGEREEVWVKEPLLVGTV